MKLKKLAAEARKAVVAAAAALGVLATALADDRVTTAEWVEVVAAAVGAVTVYLVPNRSSSSPTPVLVQQDNATLAGVTLPADAARPIAGADPNLTGGA